MKAKISKENSAVDKHVRKSRGGLLAAALAYAEQGLPVIPIRQESKKPPCIEGWPDLASTDPDVIKQWWKEFPRANVAIVTGRRSGLVVLDVDKIPGGFESLKRLLDEHGPLPATLSADTPRGGKHYFFKTKKKLRNSAGKIAEGIDVRGEGGYVVVAPSVFQGGRYVWSV